MTKPIDAIPSLIPVPVAPKSRSPSPAPKMVGEAALDTFSTLFSPPTPRASPSLEQSEKLSRNRSNGAKRSEVPLSPDSDFGAFVSVPASEDPLSSLGLFTTSNPPDVRPSQPRGTTQIFFDKFTGDAKVKHEQSKHNVLDELLLHEDDPLYFLTDEQQTAKPSSSTGPAAPIVDLLSDDVELPTPQIPAGNDLSASLSDLDLDYFSAGKAPSDSPGSPSGSPNSRGRGLSNPRMSPLRRSSSLSAARLAPPLASTAEVAGVPSPPQSDASSPYPMPIPRSSSVQTLTSLSSKWVSSLLTPSPSSTQTPPKSKNSLEGLFQEPSTSQPERTPSPHIQQRHTTPTLQQFAAHSRSTSQPGSVPYATVHRAPSTGHGASPFAPHAGSLPMTGAPGFNPIGHGTYDWDKGYSQQLEEELSVIEAEGRATPPGPVSTSISRSTSAGPEAGTPPHSVVNENLHGHTAISSLIEKKIGGNVELTGRRSMTAPVLLSELADSLRAQLPVLSRLVKSWSLVYSLDQHGISLNTLYANCDKPKPVGARVGHMVVMKDAGECLFGVWMGGGLKKGSGGYYGSGESFLWRVAPTTSTDSDARPPVEVFKWTGRNDYVALCDPEFLSFGGGDGHYGLYLDSTLLDGSSAPCPTFGNLTLCSCSASTRNANGEVKFECVGLEVWDVTS